MCSKKKCFEKIYAIHSKIYLDLYSPYESAIEIALTLKMPRKGKVRLFDSPLFLHFPYFSLISLSLSPVFNPRVEVSDFFFLLRPQREKRKVTKARFSQLVKRENCRRWWIQKRLAFFCFLVSAHLALEFFRKTKMQFYACLTVF